MQEMSARTGRPKPGVRAAFIRDNSDLRGYAPHKLGQRVVSSWNKINFTCGRNHHPLPVFEVAVRYLITGRSDHGNGKKLSQR